MCYEDCKGAIGLLVGRLRGRLDASASPTSPDLQISRSRRTGASAHRPAPNPELRFVDDEVVARPKEGMLVSPKCLATWLDALRFLN